MSVKDDVTAYEDAKCTITIGGQQYDRTIRAIECPIVVTHGRCHYCTKFRPSLRAMHSRWIKKKERRSRRKFSNNRYLTTPQKVKKLARLQARALSAERELRVLSDRISAATQANNVTVDPDLHK